MSGVTLKPMENPTATATAQVTELAAAEAAPDSTTDAPAVEADMLIEEISIDGMCGVY